MSTVRAEQESVLGQPVLRDPASARTKRKGWMFAGYIPLRRGILEHVQKGLLNKTDFAIYCLLLLLADHQTGIWWGSGKALGAYNFPRSTAQKSLQRLEARGYIRRFPVPGLHSNYPILINKYAITDGQHKGKLLDAKQTTSPNMLMFVDEHVGEHVGEHVRPSERRENREERKKKETAQASPSLAGFDSFWKAYPRKVGKPAAFKVYKRLTGDRTTIGPLNILTGLKRWMQTEQWQKEGGQFTPYPATFLNQRRWEDEPPKQESLSEQLEAHLTRSREDSDSLDQ